MERIDLEIRQRYFRKTPAYPDGTITHRANCGLFADSNRCSCGLLADLKVLWELDPAKARELYPLVDVELPGNAGPKSLK